MKVPANERVLRRTSYDHGCWVFLGARDKLGYGRISRKGEDGTVLAHRVVYEALIGPIPDGMVLDHLCRNPSCVNPWHIEPVSFRQNIERGKSAKRTHCPQGHAYSPTNTYWSASERKQVCRECQRQWQRKRRSKKKASAVL